MLLLPTLITEIRKITDPEFESFEGFPTTDAETATRWAAAFRAYMEEISNPPPAAGTPGGHSAGEAAMSAALIGMSAPGAALVLFPLGFQAYAAAFALTTAPFVSAPPPTLFVVPALPISPPPTAIAAATVLATAVDLWVRTGLTSVPPAPPAPWA